MSDQRAGTVLTVKQVARGRIVGVRTSDGRQAHWRIPRESVDAFLGVQAAQRRPHWPAALRSDDV